MNNLSQIQNPHNDSKVIDACSIFGMMDTSERRFSGEGIIRAMINMRDRGNGLGGGFAIYGLYPEFADLYAFHVMYLSQKSKQQVEELLQNKFKVVSAEEIPTRLNRNINKPPVVWRYFLETGVNQLIVNSEDNYVVDTVMEINTGMDDAYVMSSGKNMGVFKGVGYPEDIADFFRLEEYKGYLWTAHSRFPTNTPGWWGGAHPFCILDWTVVHNGEISSYGINRRYLEQFGYKCTMQTDTEVVAYAVDLLVRQHNLPMGIVAKILAPPFWEEIDRMPSRQLELMRTLRQVYGSLLLNGPFTVVIAHQNEMIGLTDRIRLRPLVVGTKDDTLYLSSEESAIRLICPDVDRTWTPMGGVPVIGSLGIPLNRQFPIMEQVKA